MEVLYTKRYNKIKHKLLPDRLMGFATHSLETQVSYENFELSWIDLEET